MRRNEAEIRFEILLCELARNILFWRKKIWKSNFFLNWRSDRKCTIQFRCVCILVQRGRVFLKSREWDCRTTKGGIMIERNSICTREGRDVWFIKIETEAFNASGQVPAATIEQPIPFQSHLCWVSQEFFKSQFESAQPNEDLRKLTEERLTRFKTFYDAHQEKNWISKRVSAPNAISVRIWSIARIYSKLLYD